MNFLAVKNDSILKTYKNNSFTPLEHFYKIYGVKIMNPLSNNKKYILNSHLFVLCQEKNTGTLFLQTNRQKTAQVALQHGVITKM